MTTVLYQIPGDVARGPLGATELERRRALLQDWAAEGTIVEVADAPGGPPSIESHLEEALCIAPMLAAVQSRRTRPDAIVVGCFGDPGLAALRQAFDCPVVGPLEASFHLGAQLGARVGIVTVVDGVVPLIDGLVRGMGLSLRYAGALAIDVPVLELRAREALVADRVVEAARRLVVRHGADVLLLGCMSLAFLGLAERAAQACGVPVVNPARCALKTAEALVSQRLVQSRRTYPKPGKPVAPPEPADEPEPSRREP
jgi:allantoin racemase